MDLRTLEGKPLWRWLLVYVWLAMLGLIMFTALWGGAASARIGQRLVENPAVVDRITAAVEQREPALAAKAKALGMTKLEPAEREKLRAFGGPVRELLTVGDRLYVHVAANVITFALIGAVAALFRQWRHAYLLVAAMLAFTTSTIETPDMRLGSFGMTLGLDALLELGACYGAAWAVVLLRTRRVGVVR
jgi:hypothetical protein